MSEVEKEMEKIPRLKKGRLIHRTTISVDEKTREQWKFLKSRGIDVHECVRIVMCAELDRLEAIARKV